MIIYYNFLSKASSREMTTELTFLYTYLVLIICVNDF